jgi:hypothetical protein
MDDLQMASDHMICVEKWLAAGIVVQEDGLEAFFSTPIL